MAEKESESETRFKHVLPGEHVYEGVLFFGYTPPDILDAVKEFEVRDDDIFLATYPKAGKIVLIIVAVVVVITVTEAVVAVVVVVVGLVVREKLKRERDNLSHLQHACRKCLHRTGLVVREKRERERLYRSYNMHVEKCLHCTACMLTSDFTLFVDKIA